MPRSTSLCSARPGNHSEMPHGNSSRQLPRTSPRESTWARHRILRGARRSSLRILSTPQLRLPVFWPCVFPISIDLQRYRVRPVVRRSVHSPECKFPGSAQLPPSIALHRRKSASLGDAIPPHTRAWRSLPQLDRDPCQKPPRSIRFATYCGHPSADSSTD